MPSISVPGSGLRSGSESVDPPSVARRIRECKPEEANCLCLNFKDFNSFDQTTVPYRSSPSWTISCHRFRRAGSHTMIGWTRISPGRSGSEYWTQIRSFGSFLCAKNTKSGARTGPARLAVPVFNAGSVVRCRTGFAYFYGTRAKADVRIQTHGSRFTSHLFNCIQYRLKGPKYRIYIH